MEPKKRNKKIDKKRWRGEPSPIVVVVFFLRNILVGYNTNVAGVIIILLLWSYDRVVYTVAMPSSLSLYNNNNNKIKRNGLVPIKTNKIDFFFPLGKKNNGKKNSAFLSYTDGW